MSAISPSYLPAARERLGSGLAALVRGRAADPVWLRPALLGTTLVTFLLYVWGLDRSGWANSYYAAAVAAGTRSWKAFFFCSFDAGNFITVDKPPAALWLMGLSARIYGMSPWSLLLPEALAGVAAAVLLFHTVRRFAGPSAALLAMGTFALTPVAVLMFRYNNPDALLTLLLVVSAWALIRALDGGRTRWLLVSATAVGFAFNTKDLQAYIVLPALLLTYLVFGPRRLAHRCLQLLGAGAVLAVSSGWWPAVVDAIPAASRPYVGGSTNNSVLDLVLGYNGLGRVFGQLGPRGPGGAGGPGGPAGFGGQPGLLRLFNPQIGGQVSWLVPLALLGLVAGIWITRRGPRTDLRRAGYVLWGLWLLTHALVFSFASGIFHAYYTVALAPAVGALVGAGLLDLWRLRPRSWLAGATLAAGLVATAWWGSQLLARTPDYLPGLGRLELGLAAASAVYLLAPRIRALARMPAPAPALALALGIVAVLLGPSAYVLATVGRPAGGGDPTAGPPAASRNFGPVAAASARRSGALTSRGAAASSELIAYLERNQGNATWLVAVQGANEAASIELASGRPVMAMGGFLGSDPAPTTSQLAQLVASGRVRFVMLGGLGGPGSGPPGGFATAAGPAYDGPPPSEAAAGPGRFAGGGGVQQARDQWVQAHCTAVTAAGVSGLYDCAA